jgi:arginase family enzyme
LRGDEIHPQITEACHERVTKAAKDIDAEKGEEKEISHGCPIRELPEELQDREIIVSGLSFWAFQEKRLSLPHKSKRNAKQVWQRL